MDNYRISELRVSNEVSRKWKYKIYFQGLETPASWYVRRDEGGNGCWSIPLDRDLILLSINQTRFATMRFHVVTLKQQGRSFVHFTNTGHTRHRTIAYSPKSYYNLSYVSMYSPRCLKWRPGENSFRLTRFVNDKALLRSTIKKNTQDLQSLHLNLINLRVYHS